MNRTNHPAATVRAKAGPRREWTTPVVTRLTAASAEFNVGPTDDSADYS